MSNRRRRVPTVFVPLSMVFVGVAALSNAMSSPRFSSFRAVDVVRLIASGMCFGVAIVGLVTFFRGRRSS